MKTYTEDEVIILMTALVSLVWGYSSMSQVQDAYDKFRKEKGFTK